MILGAFLSLFFLAFVAGYLEGSVKVSGPIRHATGVSIFLISTVIVGQAYALAMGQPWWALWATYTEVYAVEEFAHLVVLLPLSLSSHFVVHVAPFYLVYWIAAGRK